MWAGWGTQTAGLADPLPCEAASGGPPPLRCDAARMHARTREWNHTHTRTRKRTHTTTTTHTCQHMHEWLRTCTSNKPPTLPSTADRVAAGFESQPSRTEPLSWGEEGAGEGGAVLGELPSARGPLDWVGGGGLPAPACPFSPPLLLSLLLALSLQFGGCCLSCRPGCSQPHRPDAQLRKSGGLEAWGGEDAAAAARAARISSCLGQEEAEGLEGELERGSKVQGGSGCSGAVAGTDVGDLGRSVRVKPEAKDCGCLLGERGSKGGGWCNRSLWQGRQLII